MVSVAFVANFHLTETFLSVARELLRVRPDLSVTWFVFSRRWASWLRREGVPKDGIVMLSGIGGGDDRLAFEPKLLPGEPTLLEAIEGDRVLRQRSMWATLKEFAAISSRFLEVVDSRNIRAIFGESTWAVELLLCYASRSRSVPYLSPASVRIPSTHFAFFDAPLQRFPIGVAEPTDLDYSIAQRCFDGFSESTGTALWAHNRFDTSTYIRRPGLLAEKIVLAMSDARGNPTQMSLREYLRAKDPIRLRRWARESRSLMEGALKSPSEMDGPYVLMPLQVQPEASVDVLAAWARDQARNVERVAKAVPAGVRVAVKEHTHVFGSRSPADYRLMDSHSNVCLVDAFVDSQEWMAEALAVVAPSGTMCYENALRGGRSFVMSPMYFSELPSVHELSASDVSALGAVLERAECDEAASVAFLARLISVAHWGLISDPRSNPAVLDDANVEMLAAGFLATVGFICG